MSVAQKASLSLDLEQAADQLIRDACEGGNDYLGRYSSLAELASSDSGLRGYLSAVHRGFSRAQEAVYLRLLEIDRVKPSNRSPTQRGEELLLRNVMDAIGWQIIGRELYIARRLYRDGSPPSLTDSNAGSVLDVTRQISGDTFDRFGLMSDLSSFIRVGDILATGPAGGVEIIEVKEGVINEKILQFTESLESSQALDALENFRATEGEKTYAQLRRVLRQKAHSAAIANLLNQDKGTDPNYDLPITIGTPSAPLDIYDDRLHHVISESHNRGWAIDVVDGCLYLAAYRGAMSQAASSIFDVWFEGSGAGSDSQAVDFMTSLMHPLALPPFARMLPREQILDILFGRCRVMLGVHVPDFLELIRSSGVTVRPATRKEQGQFTMRGSKPLMVDGRIVIVEDGDFISALHDGILTRILFHGLSPQSAAYLSSERPTPPTE
jgi:hypothetical protein